jgi:hypothetical protein
MNSIESYVGYMEANGKTLSDLSADVIASILTNASSLLVIMILICMF